MLVIDSLISHPSGFDVVTGTYEGTKFLMYVDYMNSSFTFSPDTQLSAEEKEKVYHLFMKNEYTYAEGFVSY